MEEVETELKYTDVFVPGGYPYYTYNSRETRDLEQKVQSVHENLCKLVVVTGHTKSGKTTLVQKVLPRETAIWIDGGGINDEEDFWSTIIDELELFQEVEELNATTRTKGVSGEASVEGSVIVAKGKGAVGARIENADSTSLKLSRALSSKSTALAGLRSSRTPLVLDDFHYLPKPMQGSVVRALKPIVFSGVPIIIIAIPHRRYDAVKVEKEMTGRILSVEVPVWTEQELSYIPLTGFRLLNREVTPGQISSLACESIGSPHLMQEFCREFSRQSNEPIDLNYIFQSTAENTIGRPIFDKLAHGPRQRSDRIQRQLKNGQTVDIYGLVLEALAHIKPGLVTLEYEDLRSAIREICIPENVPNVQEVARVLKHMAEISATDESSTPVIDFDEEEKRLHVTDPFFAFYLRWGTMVS